jgi:Ino eighty subunit 1
VFSCAVLILAYITVRSLRLNLSNASIKKKDGEALTREDIQYDLLECIFNDRQTCWTDHASQYTSSARTPDRVTFRQLFVNVLVQSSKLSGNVKEKMQTDERFAVEFTKIALLVNVGRINTTMACTLAFQSAYAQP